MLLVYKKLTVSVVAHSETASQEFWRWFATSLLLPALFIVVIYAVLEATPMQNAFANCFGSGDLLPIAAMLFIVLTQEIEKIPLSKQTRFLIAFRENSVALSAIMWAAYTAIKVISVKDIPGMGDDGVKLLLKFAFGSIVVFLGVAIYCLVARVKVSNIK